MEIIMTDKKTGRTFIDWSNMNKVKTIIDPEGNVIEELDGTKQKPKTLADLAKRRMPK